MMRNASRLWLGIGVLVAAMTVGSALAASPPRSLPSLLFPLRASLDARQAVPAPKVAAPAATGRLEGALVRTVSQKRGEGLTIAWSLSWKLTTSGLTGPMTAAQIHTGRPGETGPVVLSLCAPCTSPARGVVRNLTKEQASVLRRSDLYVDIQTAANPSGEIRGQVTRRSPVRPGAPRP